MSLDGHPAVAAAQSRAIPIRKVAMATSSSVAVIISATWLGWGVRREARGCMLIFLGEGEMDRSGWSERFASWTLRVWVCEHSHSLSCRLERSCEQAELQRQERVAKRGPARAPLWLLYI